jgi:surface antigen
MKNTFTKLAILAAGMSLVGCATTPMVHHKTTTVVTKTTSTGLAGTGMSNSQVPERSADVGIARSGMDEADKNKLSHALDKAPGKSTHWINANSGLAYTVVPVQAVTIGGNHNCRKYSVTTVKGTSRHESMGTACVGDDSAWKAV